MVYALLSRWYARVLQQADSARPGLSRVHWQMGLNGLHQLPADAVQRVQRGEWVLKNRTNLAASYVAHLLIRQIVNALALQVDLSAGNAPRRLQQADDGRACQRFTRTRFTHYPQNFSGCNVKRNTVQSTQSAPAVRELDDQIFNF